MHFEFASEFNIASAKNAGEIGAILLLVIMLNTDMQSKRSQTMAVALRYLLSIYTTYSYNYKC